MDHTVTTTEVGDQPALSRRRQVSIAELSDFIRAAEEELQREARERALEPAGHALAVFHGPVNDEADSEVEVCLPVAVSGDVVLGGGTLARTDVRGADATYPRILSAYDAVAAWAQRSDRALLGPPREIYVDGDHVVVGWLVGPPERSAGSHDG